VLNLEDAGAFLRSCTDAGRHGKTRCPLAGRRPRFDGQVDGSVLSLRKSSYVVVGQQFRNAAPSRASEIARSKA
jgi:hypothetical protein